MGLLARAMAHRGAWPSHSVDWSERYDLQAVWEVGGRMKAQLVAAGWIVDNAPKGFVFDGPLTDVQIGGTNKDGDEVWFGWTLAELAEKARERDAVLRDPAYLEMVERMRAL